MPTTTAEQSRLEQLDAFVVESVNDVRWTMPNWSHTLKSGKHEANPRAFKLNEINEELRVRVFAKLEP